MVGQDQKSSGGVLGAGFVARNIGSHRCGALAISARLGRKNGRLYLQPLHFSAGSVSRVFG